MKLKPNNPFLISGYYSPDYFCNRVVETGKIIDALYNGRNLTLFAPRRIGKTGLIHHVFYKLKKEQPDIATFYMDIFSTRNLGDFVRLFANTVLGRLDTTVQKAKNRIERFIKGVQVMVTSDPLTGLPKASIEMSSGAETEAMKTTISEIFDYLKASSVRCYIAIDEFQQITEYQEEGIEALLRSYIQFSPNVNFIFAGSKQHILQEMFLSSKRPFYQSTQQMTIEAINYDDYEKFALSKFRRPNIELPKDLFRHIYDRFDGHTWYIQNVLNRLYEYGESADKELIEHAITEIINESSFGYESILRAYSTGCIRLLKAIATERRVEELLAGDFINRYDLKAASSVEGFAKKLVDRELVYKTGKGYIVYDRFMGEWLRRQQF